MMEPDLEDMIVAQEKGDEVGTIRGDADIPSAGIIFALGEVPSEPLLRI